MYALFRPSLRDVMRAVAVCIIVAFALSAMSIAYAAGRHSGQGHHNDLGSAWSAESGNAR